MSCLAVTLTNGPKPKNGRRVFDSFLEANRACFWNRDLVSAMDSLTYMGFMRPGTLFVSAPANHLQALRSAWARRVLKPACGYQIASLGDMGAIQSVQQMHFVPLGDVVCDSIAHLNRNGRPATLATVRDHIAHNCPHVAAPTIEMMRQTVNSLAATGLVYQMGDHLFVSVPAQSPIGGHKAVSIECQTGESIIDAPVEKREKTKRMGILARLFSKKESTEKVDTQPLTFAQTVPPTTGDNWMFGTRIIPTTMVPKVPATTVPAAPAKYNHYIDHHAPAPVHAQYNVATTERRSRRQRRAERACRVERGMSSSNSSSECLNYGPIDPPECLPGNAEVIDAINCQRRKRRTKRRTDVDQLMIRTSTPVQNDSADSAYSPSPVSTENEEPNFGAWSEPEDRRLDLDDNHTYVNLNRENGRYDSTQFEEFTLTTVCAPPTPPPPRRCINLISNL